MLLERFLETGGKGVEVGGRMFFTAGSYFVRCKLSVGIGIGIGDYEVRSEMR